MTSPSATPGTLTGRPYLCRACGRRLTALGAKLAHLVSATAGRPSLCRGVPELTAGAVVLDIARDDRAGITLPTAIQPVGRDQLDAGGAGQRQGEVDAGRGRREHETTIATSAGDVTENRCADGSQRFAEVG